MNVFIFQAVPERYDLSKMLKSGQTETWYATRYRNKMQKGDLVYFWQAGESERRGIYGYGEIIKEPYMAKDWDSYGVDVEYKRKYTKPLLVEKISRNSVLKDLLILRAPQATNFLLSKPEASAISKLTNGL